MRHASRYRWTVLVALTLFLLLFNTRFSLDNAPVQSIDVIGDLPAFATVFALWLLTLILPVLRSVRSHPWKLLVLVSIFTIVFLGFWITRSTYTALRQDGLINAVHVRYLADHPDRIPTEHTNLGYFNFPGMHLSTLALAQTVGPGMDYMQAAFLALVVHLVFFSGVVYIFYLKTLGSPVWAALASILSIQANIMLARYSFWPSFWALGFLVLLLTGLHRFVRGGRERWEDTCIMLLLISAIAISHFVTSIVAFFIMVSIALTHRLCRGPTSPHESRPIFSLALWALLIPLAWNSYWAIRVFGDIARIAKVVLQHFAEGGALTALLNFTAAYVGGNVPYWATATRLFWVATLLPAIVLAIWKVVTRQCHNPREHVEVGGLIGVLVASSLATALSQGSDQFYRLLLYGYFLATPINLRALQQAGPTKKWAASFVTGLLLMLSFPTFLAHNSTVAVSSYYPPELAAARFAARATTHEGRGTTVFADATEFGVLSTGVPDARFAITPDPGIQRGHEVYWNATKAQTNVFGKRPQGTTPETALFYFSKRRVVTAQHVLGISPADPGWTTIVQLLADTNKVYENGTSEVHL